MESVVAVEKEMSFATVTVQEISEMLEITPNKSYSEALQSMLNREPVVTQYLPEKKELKNIEPLLTEMVVIHGGEFKQGSNGGSRDEIPYHTIFLDSFALDICPVTNEQFVRFLEYMGGEKDENYYDLIRLKDSRINRSAGKLSIESGVSQPSRCRRHLVWSLSAMPSGLVNAFPQKRNGKLRLVEVWKATVIQRGIDDPKKVRPIFSVPTQRQS